MPIQATCPGCRSTLAVPDTLAGKVCRCGRCQTVVPVPQAPPPDVVPVAEAPQGVSVCRACGGELRAADQACPYCGKTRLVVEAAGPPDAAQWELRVDHTALAPPARQTTHRPSGPDTAILREDWTFPEEALAQPPQPPATPVEPLWPAAETSAGGKRPIAAHVTGGNPAAAAAWAAQGPAPRQIAPPRPRRELREDSGSLAWVYIVGGIALLLLLAVGVVSMVLLLRPREPEADPVAAEAPVPQVVADPLVGQKPANPELPPGGQPPAFPPAAPAFPPVNPAVNPAVLEQPAAAPANWRLPPAPEPVPITPAPVKEPTTLNLPDTVAGVAAGGGGRFLVFAFPGALKVGVFDVSQAKFTQYIPLKRDDVRVAAGMTRLVLYYPATGDLERWNLLAPRCERQAKLEMTGKVSAFCMGSASDGPLLICAQDGFRSDVRFLDLETFERLSPPGKGNGWGRVGAGGYWAGASGRIFGHTGNHGQPNGVSALVLSSQGISSTYEHWGTWYVVPGPDDKHIYAGGHGVLTDKVKAAPDAVFSGGNSGHADYMFLPAHHGPFYMHVHVKTGLRGLATKSVSPGDPEHGVTVYMLGHRKPIAQLPDVNNVTYKEMEAVREIGIEKTVHLVPWAKLLVVLPASRDRLLLVPFDVEDALAKSGINYLLVTSQPPAGARRGQRLTYTVAAKAKAGGVTYQLESGPPGMTLSPQGQLRWDVPANYAEGETSVLIAVRDASGQQIFHTFRLTVRGP